MFESEKAKLFAVIIILLNIEKIVLTLTSKKCYEECSPNEVFVECNASCQPICGASFNGSTNLDCGCVHGCVCRHGLIRSSKTKKCITTEKCQQILLESNEKNIHSENEIYSEKEAGCQPSCYTHKSNKNTNCQASSGFVCRKNFVRDIKFGECVPIAKCPNCRPGEVWQPCNNCSTFECENSCGTCACRRGYFAYNDHCISDCAHRQCFGNEEYLNCSNCENCCFNNPRTTCDKNGCYEGCFCKKGLVRDPLLGICVDMHECPVHCHPNEKFECRVKDSDKTCQNFEDIRDPLRISDELCTSSCYCSQSFVRESSWKNVSCIHFTDCKKSP